MGPVGRFKDDMSSDVVGRDEYSEDSGDSEEFEKGINPSETHLLKMNLSEINLSMKLSKKMSSFTPAERINLCWEIAMKQSSKELTHRRKSKKLN